MYLSLEWLCATCSCSFGRMRPSEKKIIFVRIVSSKQTQIICGWDLVSFRKECLMNMIEKKREGNCMPFQMNVVYLKRHSLFFWYFVELIRNFQIRLRTNSGYLVNYIWWIMVLFIKRLMNVLLSANLAGRAILTIYFICVDCGWYSICADVVRSGKFVFFKRFLLLVIHRNSSNALWVSILRNMNFSVFKNNFRPSQRAY